MPASLPEDVQESKIYRYNVKTDHGCSEKNDRQFFVQRIHHQKPFSNAFFDSGLDWLVIELQNKELVENPPYIHSETNPGRKDILITAYYLRKSITQGLITPQNLHSGLASLVLSLRTRQGANFVQTQEQFQLLLSYGEFVFRKDTP